MYLYLERKTIKLIKRNQGWNCSWTSCKASSASSLSCADLGFSRSIFTCGELKHTSGRRHRAKRRPCGSMTRCLLLPPPPPSNHPHPFCLLLELIKITVPHLSVASPPLGWWRTSAFDLFTPCHRPPTPTPLSLRETAEFRDVAQISSTCSSPLRNGIHLLTR